MNKFVKYHLRLEAHALAEACLKFNNMAVDEELGEKTWDEILDMEERVDAQAGSELKSLVVEEPLRSKELKKNQNKEIGTSSKKPVCPTCTKTFSTNKNLNRHIKIHSEEKPYQCSEQDCNLSFTRKDHLDRHMRKHSGEKPFSCDLCNEKFPYLKSLHRHMKNKVCTK